METGEFWAYDPVSNTWEARPDHPGQSRWAPASFIIDGEFISSMVRAFLLVDMFPSLQIRFDGRAVRGFGCTTHQYPSLKS